VALRLQRRSGRTNQAAAAAPSGHGATKNTIIVAVPPKAVKAAASIWLLRPKMTKVNAARASQRTGCEPRIPQARSARQPATRAELNTPRMKLVAWLGGFGKAGHGMPAAVITMPLIMVPRK
jgi:hypothetical protein